MEIEFDNTEYEALNKTNVISRLFYGKNTYYAN